MGHITYAQKELGREIPYPALLTAALESAITANTTLRQGTLNSTVKNCYKTAFMAILEMSRLSTAWKTSISSSAPANIPRATEQLGRPIDYRLAELDATFSNRVRELASYMAELYKDRHITHHLSLINSRTPLYLTVVDTEHIVKEITELVTLYDLLIARLKVIKAISP